MRAYFAATITWPVGTRWSTVIRLVSDLRVSFQGSTCLTLQKPFKNSSVTLSWQRLRSTCVVTSRNSMTLKKREPLLNHSQMQKLQRMHQGCWHQIIRSALPAKIVSKWRRNLWLTCLLRNHLKREQIAKLIPSRKTRRELTQSRSQRRRLVKATVPMLRSKLACKNWASLKRSYWSAATLFESGWRIQRKRLTRKRDYGLIGSQLALFWSRSVHSCFDIQRTYRKLTLNTYKRKSGTWKQSIASANSRKTSLYLWQTSKQQCVKRLLRLAKSS